MEDYENQASHPQSALDAFGQGDAADGGSSFVSSSDEVSCSDADVLGCEMASAEEVSECIGNKISDSQDPGGLCGIRPRILRLERLVGRQQCGGFGS